MPQYLVAPHVYVCLSDGHAVLLDLKHDKYLAISGLQMHSLAATVCDWPVCEPAGETRPAAPDDAVATLVRGMADRGLLTLDRNTGKSAAPVRVEPASGVLVDDTLDSPPEIRLADVMRFAFACAISRFSLRWLSLERVIDGVRRGKQQHTAPPAIADLASARELVAIFNYLRPFFFAWKDECLFQSLALVKFLSRYGLFPTWVFGVQARPFNAHCWVQMNGIVFNYTLEHVRRFTPIMAI